MANDSPIAPVLRRYHPKWWIRIFSIFFFAFSLTGGVHFWSLALTAQQPLDWVSILGSAFLTVVGIFLVAYHFTASVVIFADAIEFETLWSQNRLSVSEIRGRREYETTDSDGVTTQYIRLLPLDRGKKAIEFTRFYNFDDTFNEWLSRLPKVER